MSIKNRLWLLAHHDDEVLALHLIFPQISNVVVYLTDGVRIGATYSTIVREIEARKAWEKIDANAELIFFGSKYSLADGSLENQIRQHHFNELISICQARAIDEIVTLQLEGGHQDHDVTSMLAEEITNRLSLSLVVFPTYRALQEKMVFFRVMFADSNWKSENVFSGISRIRFALLALNLIRNYKSQIRTWVVLGPFIIVKYLFGNLSYLSFQASERVKQTVPTKKLYVYRNMQKSIDYQNFRKKITTWH